MRKFFNKKSIIITLGMIIIAIIFSAALVYYEGGHDIKIAQAAFGDNVFGWAWNESIGWISLNSLNCDIDGDGTYEGANEGNPAGSTPAPAGCPTSGSVPSYGINVGVDGDFTGYAWSETEGYILFNPNVDIPPYESAPKPAKLDVNTREVTGWARICSMADDFPTTCTGGNAGWIAMSTSTGVYGVSLDKANNFVGWAWSEDIGWISFSSKNCDANGDGLSDGGPNCPPSGTAMGVYTTGITTNIKGFAYSSNYDWFSFSCENGGIGGANICGSSFYGVNALGNDTGVYNLGGYAWNPNVGWLSFEESNPPADTGIAAIVGTKCDSSCNPTSGCTACYSVSDHKIYGGAKVLSLGDDGWVRLDDDDVGTAPDYGVTFTSPEFHDYGWDGDGSTAGIGWLSFNCAEGDTDGGDICGTSDYKVTYAEYFNFNHPPTVAFNPMEDPGNCLDNDPTCFSNSCACGDYCILNPQLTWVTNDPDGDAQAGYQIIFDDTDHAISTLDSLPDEGTNGLPLVTNYISGVAQSFYPTNNTFRNVSTVNMNYDRSYYSWIKVWDDKGANSGWVKFNDPADLDQDGNFDTFTTYKNDFPDPYFTWIPPKFSVDEGVLFKDDSDYFIGGAASDCSQGNCSVDWEFSSGDDPANADYNTASSSVTSFPIEDWSATSTITDSNGYSCSTSTKSKANLKLPNWIESR